MFFRLHMVRYLGVTFFGLTFNNVIYVQIWVRDDVYYVICVADRHILRVIALFFYFQLYCYIFVIYVILIYCSFNLPGADEDTLIEEAPGLSPDQARTPLDQATPTPPESSHGDTPVEPGQDQSLPPGRRPSRSGRSGHPDFHQADRQGCVSICVF